MKPSRPHGFSLDMRRASLPAILEEVVPENQQPHEKSNSCTYSNDNSRNLTFVERLNRLTSPLFPQCNSIHSVDECSETSSCGSVVQTAEGNEKDSSAVKRIVNPNLKKPFKKMASEPILVHRVDTGNSDQLLSKKGIGESSSRDQFRGSSPEQEMPKQITEGVNGGCVDTSRSDASRYDDVKPTAGGVGRVMTQCVFLNESFVGDSGSKPDGASSSSGAVAAGPQVDTGPERRRLVVGVLCLSAAFMLHFTAHDGAVTLQSTVNGAADLGTRALVVQCVVLVVSCALLPSLVIRYLGYKWTVAGCMLLYVPFVALQLWPRYETLLPAAAVMGLASGPLWTAKSAYLSASARRWAQLAARPAHDAQLRFFAVFYAFYNFALVSGNVLSFLILTAGGTETVPGALCGADFCPSDRGAAANPNFRPPSTRQLTTLYGVLVACIACAVLFVAGGLHQLHSDQEDEEYGDMRATLRLVSAAANLHRDPVQLLLVPITIFTGLTQAFFNADFTEAFVSCSWGIAHIGGVVACYGASNCAASVALGWRGRSAGHAALVSAYGGCYCLLLAALFVWAPDASKAAPFFLLAAFWGIADCGILVVNSVCGILFRGREKAAYSNVRLWETVGFLYGYACSPLLCMRVKLVVMAALLAAAVCGYWAAEYLAGRRAANSFWLQEQQKDQQETHPADLQRAALEGRWQKPAPEGNT
ncbi:UNC93-like protein [Schistocerca piceifrons]|uniref:UNC93-like protein n=1 Tax=Schistocerca piceifrons TaxID=274613 RepID=UPI001F5E526F|nr:UNC93-like protein [Schistocerca piceifrons]